MAHSSYSCPQCGAIDDQKIELIELLEHATDLLEQTIQGSSKGQGTLLLIKTAEMAGRHRGRLVKAGTELAKGAMHALQAPEMKVGGIDAQTRLRIALKEWQELMDELSDEIDEIPPPIMDQP